MRGLSRVLKISVVESRSERRLILEGKLFAPWVSPDSGFCPWKAPYRSFRARVS